MSSELRRSATAKRRNVSHNSDVRLPESELEALMYHVS